MGVSASLVHYPEHRRIGNDIMIFIEVPLVIPTPGFADNISYALYQISGISFGPGLLTLMMMAIPALIYVWRN